MGALATIWRIYARALGLLKPERTLVAILVLANLAVACFQLAEPILAGHIVDSLANGRAVLWTIALWAGLGLFNIFSSALLALMADRLAHRQKLQALVAGFERALTLTVDDYADEGAGRLVRTLHGGMTNLFDLWLAFLREHLTALFGVLLLVPTALSVDGRLAALLGLLAIMYLCANAFVIWRTHFNQREVEIHHHNVFARLGDTIANATTVRSYNRIADEVKAVRSIAAELLQAQYPVLIWWAVLTIFTRSAATVSMVAIFAAGAALAARGEVTVGQIVAFMGFATLLIGKLDQLSGFVARLFLQVASLTRFFELIDREPAPAEKADATPLGIVRGDVRFEQATFRFPDSRQGVFDLDLEVMAGETIAIVGPTGAGKSTMLALLQRFRDPHQGRVLIDRRDIRDVTVSSLWDATAVVFQQTGLFNRSIADNIRIGRPGASDAEVIAAAKLAEAHPFIIEKPDAYGYVIGEQGAALSGGERQRIAIARALLKNTPILILDEATSALDNETESKIKHAIEALRRGRTTFIIAHRMSTVVNAHRIVVIDRGRIVEKGSFADLARAGGLFERLVKAGRFEVDLAGAATAAGEEGNASRARWR